jgi:cytoskeletal protein RodZ
MRDFKMLGRRVDDGDAVFGRRRSAVATFVVMSMVLSLAVLSRKQASAQSTESTPTTSTSVSSTSSTPTVSTVPSTSASASSSTLKPLSTSLPNSVPSTTIQRGIARLPAPAVAKPKKKSPASAARLAVAPADQAQIYGWGESNGGKIGDGAVSGL